MKYFIRIIVIIGIVGILIVYFVIGYNSKPHYNRKAIFYNDTAIGLLMAYKTGKLKNEGNLTSQQFEDSIYHAMLHWYNLAIQKDSTYYLAYANKSQLFKEEMNLPDSALQALKTYYDVNKDSKIPEGLLSIGFCYEKMGDSIQALEYYKKAYTGFLKKKDTINALFSRLFIVGKDSVLKEFFALYKNDLDTNLDQTIANKQRRKEPFEVRIITEKTKKEEPIIVRESQILLLYNCIIHFDKKKFLKNGGISW